MLEGLHDTGGRDGAHYEGNADGLERLRRETAGGQARPETMAVARDRDESGDAAVSNEIIDLSALEGCLTEVTERHRCIASTWPSARQSLGKILWVGAGIEGTNGVAPDLPGRGRSLELPQEPGLLLRAENG